MDEIDKKVLVRLLEDGRASLRRIATEVGISPPVMTYRIKKMREEGVIRGFRLYVSPNFYGMYRAYAAFSNRQDYHENISLAFKCLEEVNVYEIYGRTMSELNDNMTKMSEVLGEPVVTYTPLQVPMKRSEYDRKIVEKLKENPRLTSKEIAESMNIPSKTVNRHIKYLLSKGMIRTLPNIDIPRSGIVIFQIFSRQVERIREMLKSYVFWEISDDKAGIFTCHARDLEETRKMLTAVRSLEKNAGIMLVHAITVTPPLAKDSIVD